MSGGKEGVKGVHCQMIGFAKVGIFILYFFFLAFGFVGWLRYWETTMTMMMIKTIKRKCVQYESLV